MRSKTPFEPQVDALTRAVSAFRTYAELAAACERGYIPTLLPGIQEDALAVILMIDGFRVSRAVEECEIERARRAT